MQYVNRERKPLTQKEKDQREAERLQQDAEMRLKNNRLGLSIFQGSWILVFVCLLVVYFFMGYQPGWRPTSAQVPSVILPTIATLGLILSGWFARRAWKHVEAIDPQTSAKQNLAQWVPSWRISIGFGAAFFIIMMTQFFAVPASSNGEQFGYIYRLMIGYHAVHAIAIGFMMVQIMRFGADGRYHAANSWSVEGTTKLWYFVVAAWLMFYAVLYLPYLLS